MPYGYLWMPIDWNLLGIPIIVCVCIPFGRVYFKVRCVKKDSVPDLIEDMISGKPWLSVNTPGGPYKKVQNKYINSNQENDSNNNNNQEGNLAKTPTV